MAEMFADELRNLLAGAQQPGPMYQGWQNPLTDPNDKGPNGVYATPFDRQGGPAVAEEELRVQIAGALSKFMGPNYDRAAIDEVLRIMKGTNQSPADKGAGATPPVSAYTQTAYGSQLSAGQPGAQPAAPQAPATFSTPAQFAPAPAGVDPGMWMRMQAFMAAEDEKRKKEDDDKKREEESNQRKAEMGAMLSAVAPSIAEVIKTQVAASVDAALVACGIKAPAQMSMQPGLQTAPDLAPNPMGGQAGLAFQAGNQMSAPQQQWQSLPGVQVPVNMGVPTNNATVSDEVGPHQAQASKFAQLVQEKMSAMTDPGARGRLVEELRSLYTPIAMGLEVVIDDPLMQGLATAAGIQYRTMGFGGVR